MKDYTLIQQLGALFLVVITGGGALAGLGWLIIKLNPGDFDDLWPSDQD